jgi:3'(2'), 5'-bisphosphate nucleotidase
MLAASPDRDAFAADAVLAEDLARMAGELLLTLQRCAHFEGKALGAAGDAVSHAFLVRALAAARPEDGLLSEEAAADPQRLAKSRAWIIDPLDGTREYSERRTDWAVHVALAVDGEAVVGAVGLPGLDIVLTSAGSPGVSARPERPRMLVSRTRPGADSLAVAEAIGADLVAMGSAGAKAMSVVRGEAEIYLHSGGQYEWDSCAPVAVARAHGLHVSRADGSPLVYNCADPYLPDLLICRREWAGPVLEARNALQVSGGER